MKVIISHDVDHLYNTDHCRDLYFPKLWFRSSMDLVRHKLTTKEWALQMAIPFKRKMHNLEELMQLDAEYGIPSTFFFGMASGLGMSYRQKTALPLIRQVQKRDFAVGVHGIAYSDYKMMKKEYDDFAALIGTKDFGIRIHYVRYDDSTFEKLSDIGYSFDTSEFDKAIGFTLKSPYKIGDMWEFPLNLMDSYLPYDFEKAKEMTLKILQEAEQIKLPYLTALFHDNHFSENFGQYYKWYQWLLDYLKNKAHEFISFKQAIQLLEKR